MKMKLVYDDSYEITIKLAPGSSVDIDCYGGKPNGYYITVRGSSVVKYLMEQTDRLDVHWDKVCDNDMHHIVLSFTTHPRFIFIG